MRLINTKCELRVAGAYAYYAEVEGVAVSYSGIYGHPLAGTVQKVLPGAFADFLTTIAPGTPGKPKHLPDAVNAASCSTTGYWVHKTWEPETKVELADTSNGTLSFFDTTESLKFRLKLDKDDEVTNEFYKNVLAGFNIMCSVSFDVAAPVFQGGFGNSVHPAYETTWDQKLLQYVITIKRCGIAEIWFHQWKDGY
jgi:hypothetical protein